MIKKGLGKGLNALISNSNNEQHILREDGLIELKINDIEPNLKQPRKFFDDEKLQNLTESIKQYGVVQPIIVNKENDTYKIVAGERRWRAARLAGLTEIPVIIKNISNKEMMEIALIENLQRQDLNPIEEAEAYIRLIEDYKMTHEELSNIVGRSRPVITNSLRLLSLAEEIKEMLINNEISTGHARAILGISDKNKQIAIAKDVINNELNVRQTELLVKKVLNSKNVKPMNHFKAEFEQIESKFKDIFRTKVKIFSKAGNKGKIMIEYYSNDELDRIIDLVHSIKE